MFRQKIAQVTDCSCRLFPNGKSEYILFKKQVLDIKPIQKEPKEKYSLKAQTLSSNKHQAKTISAQKPPIKPQKQIEDEKISISANIDLKKKLQQTSLFCPQISQIKQVELRQNHYDTNDKVFCLDKNAINAKTAEASRGRQQNKYIRNTHNQAFLQNQFKKQIIVSNFGVKPSNFNNGNNFLSKDTSNQKRAINFQQYYKVVSNPYSKGLKNKENTNVGQHNTTKLVTHREQLQNRIVMKGLQRESIPLQEVNFNVAPQVFHQSLQKFQHQKSKYSKGAYNGTFTTKNSMNSQISQKESNVRNQKQKQFIYSRPLNLVQKARYDFKNIFSPPQLEDLASNKSQIFTSREVNTHRVQKNQHKRNQILTEADNNQDDKDLEMWKHEAQSFFAEKKTRTVQSSQIHQGKGKCFKGSPKDRHPQMSQIFLNLKASKKLLIERVNTFNDIISNKAECQSVVDEGENQNQQSVVLMRYNDFVEASEQKDQEPESQQQLFELKNDKQNYNIVLKQLNLMSKQDYEGYGYKNRNKQQVNESKYFTNVKQYGKKQNFNSINQSNISYNCNMKKTVKLPKEYITHNFNAVE